MESTGEKNTSVNNTTSRRLVIPFDTSDLFNLDFSKTFPYKMDHTKGDPSTENVPNKLVQEYSNEKSVDIVVVAKNRNMRRVTKVLNPEIKKEKYSNSSENIQSPYSVETNNNNQNDGRSSQTDEKEDECFADDEEEGDFVHQSVKRRQVKSIYESSEEDIKPPQCPLVRTKTLQIPPQTTIPEKVKNSNSSFLFNNFIVPTKSDTSEESIFQNDDSQARLVTAVNELETGGNLISLVGKCLTKTKLTLSDLYSDLQLHKPNLCLPSFESNHEPLNENKFDSQISYPGIIYNHTNPFLYDEDRNLIYERSKINNEHQSLQCPHQEENSEPIKHSRENRNKLSNEKTAQIWDWISPQKSTPSSNICRKMDNKFTYSTVESLKPEKRPQMAEVITMQKQQTDQPITNGGNPFLNSSHSDAIGLCPLMADVSFFLPMCPASPIATNCPFPGHNLDAYVGQMLNSSDELSQANHCQQFQGPTTPPGITPSGTNVKFCYSPFYDSEVYNQIQLSQQIQYASNSPSAYFPSTKVISGESINKEKIRDDQILNKVPSATTEDDSISKCSMLPLIDSESSLYSDHIQATTSRKAKLVKKVIVDASPKVPAPIVRRPKQPECNSDIGRRVFEILTQFNKVEDSTDIVDMLLERVPPVPSSAISFSSPQASRRRCSSKPFKKLNTASQQTVFNESSNNQVEMYTKPSTPILAQSCATSKHEHLGIDDSFSKSGGVRRCSTVSRNSGYDRRNFIHENILRVRHPFVNPHLVRQKLTELRKTTNCTNFTNYYKNNMIHNQFAYLKNHEKTAFYGRPLDEMYPLNKGEEDAIKWKVKQELAAMIDGQKLNGNVKQNRPKSRTRALQNIHSPTITSQTEGTCVHFKKSYGKAIKPTMQKKTTKKSK